MKKKHIRISTIIKYVFLTIASVISVFPFFWMIVSSTNITREINAGKLTFGTHLLENLQSLFQSELNFPRALLNSALIAIITTFLALLLSSVSGYGFEIFRSRTRDKVFNVLLLSMMIPFCALMIPLYRGFSSVGRAIPALGLNTLFAVIAPSVCTAFLIFFFRQNTKSFPKDILEAARIDGMNELSIFFHIYVPVMKPAYRRGTECRRTGCHSETRQRKHLYVPRWHELRLSKRSQRLR